MNPKACILMVLIGTPVLCGNNTMQQPAAEAITISYLHLSLGTLWLSTVLTGMVKGRSTTTTRLITLGGMVVSTLAGEWLKAEKTRSLSFSAQAKDLLNRTIKYLNSEKGFYGTILTGYIFICCEILSRRFS